MKLSYDEYKAYVAYRDIVVKGSKPRPMDMRHVAWLYDRAIVSIEGADIVRGPEAAEWEAYIAEHGGHLIDLG